MLTDDGQFSQTDDVGQGTQQISPATGASTSGTAAITREEFDRLAKEVAASRVDRDKGLSRANKRLDDLSGEIKPLLERTAQLMASGKSVDAALAQANSEQEDAETQAALRDIARDYRNGTLQFTPTAPGGAVVSAEAAALVARYKFDPTDAEVATLLNSRPADMEGALAKLRFRRDNAPSPNAAQAPAPLGGNAQASSDEGALLRDYTREMLAARGKPGDVRAIKERFRSQGLPVDRVVLPV